MAYNRKNDLLNRFHILNIEEMNELRSILYEELPIFKDVKDPKAIAIALMLARIEQIIFDDATESGAKDIVVINKLKEKYNG